MKSSFCSGGGCIEIEQLSPNLLEIQETDKELNNDCCQSLICRPASFAAFIKGVKAGEFDHFAED